MNIFEQFPYSNFHDLNLDWILEQVKNNNLSINEFTTLVNESITTANNILDTITLSESARGSAEIARINAENSRTQSENARTSAEIIRAAFYNNFYNALTAANSGAPIPIANLAALNSAHPAGDTRNYVALDSGLWYGWNGSEWQSGGKYQETGISNAQIKAQMLSPELKPIYDLLWIYPMWELGTVYSANGTYIDSTTRIRTVSKLTVKAGTIVSIKDGSNYKFGVTRYTSAGTFIEQTAYMTSAYTVPADCLIAIVIAKTNDADLTGLLDQTSAQSIILRNYLAQFVGETLLDSTMQTYIKSLKPLTDLSYAWELGTVSIDGSLLASTSRIRLTAKLLVTTGTIIKLKDTANYVFSITRYNSATHAFIEQIAYRSTNYTVTADCEIIIVIKRSDDSNLTNYINQTGSKIAITTDYPFIIGEKVKDGSLGLEKLNSDMQKMITDKRKRYIHMSFDDVIAVFSDLTANAGTYTSIFNNPTLAWLKSMHDIYDMVFSLYCFYTDGTFDLSQCPSTYAAEFKANSSWLKFGFHGYDASSNYSAETAANAKTHYDLVVSNLYRICGGFDSIDRVIRAGYFTGNLDSVNAWKTTNCSIKGLLSADDARTSYYHNAEQVSFLQTHSFMTDSANNMIFWSTDLRLENYASSPYTELASRYSNIYFADRMDNLIIFSHETYISSYHTQIEECGRFAKEYGYVFDFPMNRIN